MLPGRSGLAVLSALRSRGIRTPVLILTARDAVDDKVRGLDVGADDYMTKPFALTELLARVRALIRRASPEPMNELVAGPIVVDTCARVVRQGGTAIDLTAREYAILELLARRKGTVVTRVGHLRPRLRRARGHALERRRRLHRRAAPEAWRRRDSDPPRPRVHHRWLTRFASGCCCGTRRSSCSSSAWSAWPCAW